MKAVIDTNVLLVANGQHADVSPGCVAACVERLQAMQSGGVTVIDDTYNANPESMAAAIETLAEAPMPDSARRFVVLGRMGELGNQRNVHDFH